MGRSEASSAAEPVESENNLEPAVIRSVIGLFSAVAVLYNIVALLSCWDDGGLIGVGRGLSAVGLGWMCGWYFTVRFAPTTGLLRNTLLQLAGHLVSSFCMLNAWLLLGALDWLGASPDRATFLSIGFVTFAPVAAYFATQLNQERAVHLVAGMGIGGMSYVVLFGMPD